jgi:hypothetical protein
MADDDTKLRCCYHNIERKFTTQFKAKSLLKIEDECENTLFNYDHNPFTAKCHIEMADPYRCINVHETSFRNKILINY